MSYLDTFMEASKDSESPTSFWLWAGICSIGAVARRNVWIERPSWKTFPNLFVFFVADSGLRKGPPISMAKEVVTALNVTRVISGRASVQGIISHLGTAYTLANGDVVDKAHGFIAASEFSSGIVRDPDALTNLTDLYDSCYHNEWEDMLRGGKVRLKEPYITILGGINPPHFENFIDNTALEGGFIGRSLLVFENKKARINAAIRGKDNNFDKTEVIKQLKEISKVKGEMKLSEGAVNLYESWYLDFETRREKKTIKDKTGSVNRVAENILKVAILISLSRSPDLDLNEEDMQTAMSMCLTMLANVNKTTVSQGNHSFAPQTKLVLSELMNAKNFTITRSAILSRNYGAIDAMDLDRIVDSLQQSKALTQERIVNDIRYSLTEHAINQIKGLET